MLVYIIYPYHNWNSNSGRSIIVSVLPLTPSLSLSLPQRHIALPLHRKCRDPLMSELSVSRSVNRSPPFIHKFASDIIHVYVYVFCCRENSNYIYKHVVVDFEEQQNLIYARFVA